MLHLLFDDLFSYNDQQVAPQMGNSAQSSERKSTLRFHSVCPLIRVQFRGRGVDISEDGKRMQGGGNLFLGYYR